ncbi:MAG: tRNA uridine-5-carboxymethylaminomethyl(34) synthesis GTPase MnmE [Candidatus Omnitrophica bacterium]|nr:tRNA uridine-5-carboxymethylaminomethyl(34) synthesis GTPase MnmE [Candidatus Omnitrophota bacterium]
MYQYQGMEDTIVAIATPMGQGGIGLVRLSGQQSIAIADKMFLGRSGQKPSGFKTFSVHYGDVFYPQVESLSSKANVVDEVLLTVMLAPKSYTTEDVVEISCHGGLVVLETIVKIAMHHGARLAEPGEFTKRAFLNGRIDLTQAEAVLDVIQSRTDKFLQVSTHQLKGDLSVFLERIRTNLMHEYTHLEALINFPEEEIDSQGSKPSSDPLIAIEQDIKALLDSSRKGQILKEGLKVVFCGKPNVGKSSLLNVLLKHPRAIVSHIAGTTRDTIEEVAHIQGIPFQLIDTAGILEPCDAIEQEAVRRSHTHRQSADVVVLVLDQHQALDWKDEKIIEVVQGQNVIVLFNKCDLPKGIDDIVLKEKFPTQTILFVSALTRTGIEAFEEAIVQQVLGDSSPDHYGLMISNLRHVQSLRDCQKQILSALDDRQKNLSLEFVSDRIKRAVNSLDQITGRNIDFDLIDQIFSQFCIGK